MRVKRGVASHRKHHVIRQATKGMTHARHHGVRMGRQGLVKALQYAYRDRRNRKRTYRELWNSRINSAAREHGLNYSQFINGLKNAKIELNRKMLAELAVSEPTTFEAIVNIAKKSSK
jgi:large subunit ribosomal protein L20